MDTTDNFMVFILLFLFSTFKDTMLPNLKNHGQATSDTHKPYVTAIFKVPNCFLIHNSFF
jgi:hypothetical protein